MNSVKQKRKRCSRPVFSTKREVNIVDGITYDSRTSNIVVLDNQKTKVLCL